MDFRARRISESAFLIIIVFVLATRFFGGSLGMVEAIIIVKIGYNMGKIGLRGQQ